MKFYHHLSMNMAKNNRVFFMAFVFFLLSCGEEEKQTVKDIDYAEIKEDMIDVNRGWTEEENQMIENYVRRRNWKMVKTGTGIRYWVYERKDTLSDPANEGDEVFINYQIRLLEGDSLCYDSEGEPESFIVAMDHVENGLHEVVTYMRKGDKAKVILPYNRAFGLVGDMDQIPPQATLVYDMEITEIKKAKK